MRDIDLSIAARALKIRQDWSPADLSKYSDKELVKTWNDWFMTNQDDAPETYLEYLAEDYPEKT